MSDVIKMPSIGLGTFLNTQEDEVISSVKYALSCGYRHIDTASIYKNESLIANAIELSEIPRNELFITTKIWNDVTTYEKTIKAFERSLQNLKTDYIDLVLIHWPKDKKRNAEVYRALEFLLEKGSVRLIGVSNFMIHHIQDLLETAQVVPMMNQVELHPFLQQNELKKYCDENQIALTSYGPFAKGDVFKNETLSEIAKKHKCSISQVVISWANQRNIFMIPKSVNNDRIKQNFESSNVNLDENDMSQIRKLNDGYRRYPSPDNIDF